VFIRYSPILERNSLGFGFDPFIRKVPTLQLLRKLIAYLYQLVVINLEFAFNEFKLFLNFSITFWILNPF